MSAHRIVENTLFKGDLIVKDDFQFGLMTYFEAEMIKIVEGNGLTVVGNTFTSFDQGFSFTGNVQLKESGVDVHTWPGERYVQLLVHLCDFSKDNSMLTVDVGRDMANLFGYDPDASKFLLVRTDSNGDAQSYVLDPYTFAGFP